MSVSVLGEEIAVVLGVLDGIPVVMSISHTCCSDWLSRWRDAKVKVMPSACGTFGCSLTVEATSTPWIASQ